LRRDYEEKVQSGFYPQHETRVPLFPYQREGMLHLAFNERALLADEMGLNHISKLWWFTRFEIAFRMDESNSERIIKGPLNGEAPAEV